MRASDKEPVGGQGVTVTRYSLGGTGFGNMYRSIDQAAADEPPADELHVRRLGHRISPLDHRDEPSRL